MTDYEKRLERLEAFRPVHDDALLVIVERGETPEQAVARVLLARGLEHTNLADQARLTIR